MLKRSPSAPAASRTPLMEQYAGVKREHPGALLFFRLGDFYELFFEDAVTAAGLLGLTLTSRNKSDPEPIPMCGLPWHQRDAYVARLLRLGHKVAICDQLEDPSQAKGLVQRGVTEVLTPGTVTAEAFLDPSAGNDLAALWPNEDAIGLCLADASSGDVRLLEVTWDEAPGALSRQRVAEWVVPEGAGARLEALLRGLPGPRSSVAPAGFLGRERLEARWGAARLADLADLPLALQAAAGALDYLDRMQGGAALPGARLERLRESDALALDGATLRHLEVFEAQPGGEARQTLWHHLNLAQSGPGARRLRRWLLRPLARIEPLRRRHDAVAAWLESPVERGRLREKLKGFPDVERLTARLAAGRSTPRELGSLRDALERLPAVREAFAGLAAPAAAEALAALEPAPEPLAMLRAALADDPPPVSRDGGVIRAGHDAYRDELDALAHSGKRWIADLEAGERERTGIPSLKVGFNRVFGYYLEVTRTHLEKVPQDWERRQTLTSAERFVTPALKARESEVLGAEEKLKAREHELFVQLRDRAATHVAALQRIAEGLASLDAVTAAAEAASRYGWVRPELSDSDRLRLEGSRHPVVERLLPRGEFVPNDVDLDASRRQVLLLTGPNMGGKSTYLRQIALAVLLAQSGWYVPAARAEIGLVDRLFTRVGAADRLGAGQSTFMVEMTETAEILRSATARSLVLLDEVGRGTATYDGLALAWAVTEHLAGAAGPRPRTVFATHYHELTQLAERLPRIANVQVAVKEWEGRVVFLHRIEEGAADRSYGIHVAELAGIPAGVLARAREVLRELESERTADHLGPGARAAGAEGAPAAPEGERRRGRAAAAPEPLPLFAAAEPPVLEALRAIEPESLTPLEALKLLDEWKRRWGGGPA